MPAPDDEDRTAGAELDWDLEDLERFMASEEAEKPAPVDVLVEADD